MANLFKRYLVRYRIATIIFVSLFSLFGISLAVRAATIVAVTSEPESGTLTACATKVTDSGASQSGAVSYGTCAPVVVPSTITGVPAGMATGSLYENAFNAMTAAQKQTAINTMKQAGVTWLRVDVPSTYPNDSLIQYAITAGMKVDAVIQNWSTASTSAAMGAYAKLAAVHLKAMGVSTYEVLNETNGCQGTITAADYTAILKTVYTSIKSVDANSTVMSAGFCPAGGVNEPYTYLTAMYAAGAHGYLDAVAMHPYSYPDTPSQTSDSWNPWSYLTQMHTIMANNGDGAKQLWLTEFGCPTGTDGGFPASCTDATLATQITQAFTLARTQSWVGPLFLYSWQDSTGGDGDFGLYTVGGAAKPLSLAAFKKAAAN